MDTLFDKNLPIARIVEAIYQADSRRVLATLIRLLHDFDLAEEALHDAFAAALVQWPVDGVPANARAWLVSTGRFKAIDHLRRRTVYNASLAELATLIETDSDFSSEHSTDAIEDDQLKLIFTCCHPSLSQEAQIALTLREMCGLTTEEIARAFFTTPSTIAQRIVRAKNKIRDARIPYQIPSAHELPERLQSVLHVIYLLFNEGYSATSGADITRQVFTREAIRLGQLLVALIPMAEALGLLGLMLVHDARRLARIDDNGNLMTLELQNRALWDHDQIAFASRLIQRALVLPHSGVYSLQAAIAAVHAEAPNYAATNWLEIVGLYDALMRVSPSAIVELNRAVAVSMHLGPAAGLQLVLAIGERGELHNYYLWHAACADFYCQLEQFEKAKICYMQALSLTQQEPERRFLQAKLAAL